MKYPQISWTGFWTDLTTRTVFPPPRIFGTCLGEGKRRGVKVRTILFKKKHYRRLRKAQKKLSRKQKGSKNRQKCHRDFMTTTTTTTMMTNTATLLPSLEVNNVRQAQADQECQQQMNTTTTMTAIAMAAPTPPVPLPTVIQPVLPLTLNDNLPCNINVPTSSHLQCEFQIRDGRINALEIELQGRINALEREVQQMSAQLNIR